ncbi:MAG: DUF5106 domain-containing protein [Bacteroidales bacterium]|nr:DUF5106 domain-containing protein [Bacteroidales bacterium]
MAYLFIRQLKNVILIVVFNTVLIVLSYSKGYNIGLEINGFADTTAILGHYLNKSMYPDDTTFFNSKGKGVFKGNQLLPQGMYLIFLPDGSYFELIIGEDQEFEIKTDTSNLITNLHAEGSLENEIFFDFQKYMYEKRKVLEESQKTLKNSDNEADSKNASQKIKELNEERKQKINNIIKNHPELFVSTFLKATLYVEVPEPPADLEGPVDTTQWKYYYLRKHFFDNLDPGDVRLLRTPLYEDKLMYYIDNMVPQIPDTLIKEVDFLIGKSRSDSALFRYMLITLFNHYGKKKIMGMDAVQVHIAKQYYLDEAWWSSDEFISDLRDKIEKIEPLLIGEVAPDYELMFVQSEHFKEAQNDEALKKYPHAGKLMKMSDIQADYTVLLFWESGCSHCKKEVPKLYKIYNDTLKSMNVKIIAISTLFGEEGKIKWVDFVNKNQLYNWDNAWNPYSAEYKIGYDIMSTPQIFVLDKNRKIIGKKLGADNVVGLINAHKEQFGDKQN